MTLREAEDVAAELRTAVRMEPGRLLFGRAAEAIEWLLKELDEAERYADWLELNPE